jgi:hypothetical protein
MPDLDQSALFGEQQQDEAVPWPHGYGNTPPLLETTLFGQIAEWKLHPWPEGYGGKP